MHSNFRKVTILCVIVCFILYLSLCYLPDVPQWRKQRQDKEFQEDFSEFNSILAMWLRGLLLSHPRSPQLRRWSRWMSWRTSAQILRCGNATGWRLSASPNRWVEEIWCYEASFAPKLWQSFASTKRNFHFKTHHNTHFWGNQRGGWHV